MAIEVWYGYLRAKDLFQMNLVKSLLGNRSSEPECFQCGLIPGRQYMVTTAEPIIHPHECSWCKSIVFFPGPKFQCETCNPGAEPRFEPVA